MPRANLGDILAGPDELNLLDVKPRAPTSGNREEADVVAKLEAFVARHGRPPGSEGGDLSERLLAAAAGRLGRTSERIVQLLALAEPEPQAPSLDDILSGADELGLLDDANSIFTLRHVQARVVEDAPDYIGSRKPCRDFDRFKPLFEAVVADLEVGRCTAIPFAREQEIAPGHFFIERGLMAYVAEAGEEFQDAHGNRNRRLRVIFANGTEGDPLLRSFASGLYNDENGRRITDPFAGPLFAATGDEPLTERATGYVYLVRSLSTDPAVIRHAEQLHKIGVTAGEVSRRIANASQDPTFLLAPVRLVRTYTLYNVDPVKLENLLHRFFEPARADITIADRFGRPVRPREWFLVAPEAVAMAVDLLREGTLARHRYDPQAGLIVPTP